METEYAVIPIEDFNSLFEGKAKIEVIDSHLEITVDGVALEITLPTFAGAKATDLLSHS
jgi:hypothetical protein